MELPARAESGRSDRCRVEPMEDSLPGDSPGSSPTDHATGAAYPWPPSLIRMLNRLRRDTRASAAVQDRSGIGQAMTT